MQTNTKEVLCAKDNRPVNGQHAPSACVSERAAYAQYGTGISYRSSASAQYSPGFIASAKREVPENNIKNSMERKQEITSPNKPGLVVSQERLFQVTGIKNGRPFAAGFVVDLSGIIISLRNDCAPILRWIFNGMNIEGIKRICAQRHWSIEEVR